MLKLDFDLENRSKLQILCLGAHCDDIEIGCGGTLLRLLQSQLELEVYWVVFSSNEIRRQEAINCAEAFLHNVKNKTIIVKEFRDGFFPYTDGDKIKDFFEQKIKRESSPDIIFTHYRNDLHQDHRVISDLTWNTYRDHFILEYEITKYDGDLGHPNFYSHLDEKICQKKIQLLTESFVSQLDNHWFDKESFLSLMRLRGIESNSLTRYAEAFHSRKLVL